MIHLSKFIIGIRHNRTFRIRSLSGQLVDNLVRVFPKDFPLVTEIASNEEFVLRNSTDNIFLRCDKDNTIIENRKLFDYDVHQYIEVDKTRVIQIAEESLPIVAKTLSLKEDFNRIGMVFEFRLPKWEAIMKTSICGFIYDNFVNFEKDIESDIGETNLRFSFKLRAPGGAAVKKLLDYRNVIIVVDESKGIDEQGKEQECLLISVDIQHIFDPNRDSVNVKEHYNFCKEYLSSVIFPRFQKKGIKIIYE